jgi:glycosyltransferase involved in cell wall biosynthesis
MYIIYLTQNAFMNKRRALFILNDLRGGGAERVFVNLANGLKKDGIEATFLLGTNEGVYFDLLDPEISIHELKASSLLQFITKLISFLRKNRYDHIFTANDYISTAAIIAKRVLWLRNTKVHVTLHSNLQAFIDTIPKKSKYLLLLLHKLVIRRASNLIAVSSGVADAYRAIIHKNLPHLRVIYNPVFDDSIYQKARSEVAPGLIREGGFNIVSIGKLDKNKNQQLLIDAVNKLKQFHSDIHLYIIGDGVERARLESKINNLELDQKVQIIDFQQNPFPYLSNSNLLVLSSFYEGLPNVLIEAMALGVNMVSTNCPSGPAEILENGKYGWLCEVNNPTDMAAKIEAAYKDPFPKEVLMEASHKYHSKNAVKHYLSLL